MPRRAVFLLLLFLNGQEDLGADFIYTRTPEGEEKEVLIFAENYSHVYLSKVLQALSLMKKAADEDKAEKEKAQYEEWLKSDDGMAFERENLEQQIAYENKEEQK